MTEKRTIPLQLREAEVCAFETRAADAEGPATISFALSSEAPVERFFGTEILSHESGAVRMERIKKRAMPLLFNHNWDDPVGMVDTGELRDGRLYVDAHLFDTDRAQEVAAMLAGGLRNVSVGYRIHDAEEDRKSGEFRVTDWEPYEASIVTIPADPSVGIGRSGEHQFEASIRSINPANTADRSTAMTDNVNAPAGASADEQGRQPTQNSLDLERQRTRTIESICKANGIDDNVRNLWITSGTPIDKVGDELLAILKERGEKNPQSVTKLGLSESETKRFSLARAILAVRDDNWSKAGFEAECSREIAQRMGRVPDPKRFFVPLEVQHDQRINRSDLTKRDLTVASAGGGGYLVETQNVGFIELLRNRAVAMRLGAMSLPGLVGNVTIPRQSVAGTAYWLASESTQITESQQTFVQVALSPKNVGAYTEISRQLLLQSSPAAESIVNRDLAAIVALAVDQAAINGSGASGQPTGIINTAGIGSVSGTSIAYAGLLEFQTDVASNNVEPVRGGYATTAAVAALLMQRVKFTNTASPLWDGNVWDGNVCGFPGLSSAQMPSANILFGDWNECVIGEWGVLEIEVNPYANFQAGICGVRAIYSVDVAVRRPFAFSLATSVT
jgi:HK97 family phage major capsid protein/HK97 family phage prohead protease